MKRGILETRMLDEVFFDISAAGDITRIFSGKLSAKEFGVAFVIFGEVRAIDGQNDKNN